MATLVSTGLGGSPPAPTRSVPTLRERAAARGLLYGAAIDSLVLGRDSGYAELLAEECGILVPENDLKWSRLRPSFDAFDFSRADAIAEFAFENDMLFRGHTLVWHNQLPRWFDDIVDSWLAERVLLAHIAAVAGRYARRMHSWDVVNEGHRP